jgi:hypothetical protein
MTTLGTAGHIDHGKTALVRALTGAHGRAVRLGPAMHVDPDALAAVTARLVAAIERDGSITLARARDELGTSRKNARPTSRTSTPSTSRSAAATRGCCGIQRTRSVARMPSARWPSSVQNSL